MKQKKVDQDKKGAFAKSQADGSNDGTMPAKPRVITGSDDSTAHKRPPGQKSSKPEWSVNYAIRDQEK